MEHYINNPPVPAKCFTTPSLTIPDLSLSIDELLVRYERGLPLPIQKSPLYEDPNLPSSGRCLAHMDLIDLHWYKKDSMQRLEILRESIEKTRQDNDAKLAAHNRKYHEYHEWIDKKRKEEQGDSSTKQP